MTSGGSSTITSPPSSFARFFRRKSPSPTGAGEIKLVSTAPVSPTFPTGVGETCFVSPTPVSPASDDIHQVFNYFDENGDGKISATELQSRLRKVGGEEVQLSDEEAEMAVRSSDADGDGVLGLDDFAKMMKEGEEEELRGAFVMYSTRGGGVITPKSLKKMMRRLGQSTTVDDCKTMIGRFDRNGDGVLNYDDFRAMMS